MYSQASSQFSQEDYLTPATQDHTSAPFLPPHYAIASPSPIKKKSRPSRRGSNGAATRHQAMMMSVLPEGIPLPNGGHAINHKSPRDALPPMQVHPGPILHAGDTHRSLGKAQGSHASNSTLPSSLGREEGNPSPPTPSKLRERVDRRLDPRHKPLNRDLHGLPASPLHSRASLGSASVLRARDASVGLTSSSSSSASSSASPPPSASFLPPRGPGPDALGPGLDLPHPHRSDEKRGSSFQSLSQSVVDCFGSLRVHGPSPEEVPNE